MWEQGYGNAGGFYEQGATQGGTPSGGEKKRQRAQNLVPVSVRTILDCGEDSLKVEGQEVGMVTVVGKVLSVEHAETKSTYVLEDDSGSVEAVHWVEETSAAKNDGVSEGTHARIVGSVRSQSDKKYVMIFRISPVECPEEVDAHKLEILHAKLKIKQLAEKENAAIGANAGGLSNSMMTSSSSSGVSNSFGNAKHDAVYKMVAGCDRDEGIGRDELFQQLASRMSKNDVNASLTFLSEDGHIYSTTDDDHFKTTDS